MSMKNFNDTIGNRTRDLRLVAQCLSQLRHRLSHHATWLVFQIRRQREGEQVWMTYPDCCHWPQPICGGKVVPVYAMKAQMGSRGTAPLILNFGTRCRSTSHPSCLYCREGTPVSTHWLGSWVGPKACLNVWVMRKAQSLPGFEPRTFKPVG